MDWWDCSQQKYNAAVLAQRSTPLIKGHGGRIMVKKGHGEVKTALPRTTIYIQLCPVKAW